MQLKPNHLIDSFLQHTHFAMKIENKNWKLHWIYPKGKFILKNRTFTVQGAAAFWYNVRRSGEGDSRMVHAGCPVLLGDKWGTFLWICYAPDLFFENTNSNLERIHNSSLKTIYLDVLVYKACQHHNALVNYLSIKMWYSHVKLI